MQITTDRLRSMFKKRKFIHKGSSRSLNNRNFRIMKV